MSGASGTAPSVPVELLGPLFIANCLNWLALGVLFVQFYNYFKEFSIDRLFIRIIVYTLLVLELVQTATTTHQAWIYTISDWSNPASFLKFPWSAMTVPLMAGLIAAVVQLFYSWRIWVLSRSNYIKVVVILIALLSVAQCLTATVTGIVFQMDATPEKLQSLHPEFATWLATSFIADILIAICMSYVLTASRGEMMWKKTDAVITKLVVMSVGTGALLAFCGLVTLILFATTVGQSFQYLPGAYITGKVYSNSAMVTLNSRQRQRSTVVSVDDSLNARGSVPLEVRISRHTNKTGDHTASYSKDATLSLNDTLSMERI